MLSLSAFRFSIYVYDKYALQISPIYLQFVFDVHLPVDQHSPGVTVQDSHHPRTFRIETVCAHALIIVRGLNIMYLSYYA